MKNLLGSVALALTIIVTLGTPSAAATLMVGFIYVGPLGDHGGS